MIRNFTYPDLEKILEIENRAFPKKSSYDKSEFLYYFKFYTETFLVYENDKEILGYIIFNPRGHIISLAVDPLHRRKGIGTKLVKEVLKRSGGGSWVEVRESDNVAREFYKKLGFKEKKVIPNYYSDEDAIVMKL